MYISISFFGIEQHIFLLEEEEKFVRILIEKMNELYHIECENLEFDLNGFRKSMEDLNRLKKSIQFRMDFLESLVIDFRKIKNDNQILLEELEERLRQLNLDSTHL